MILKLLVFVLVYLTFMALFPLKYLKGDSYLCSIPSSEGLLELDEDSHNSNYHTALECFDNGGNWILSDTNYDNLLISLLHSFFIPTSEGWITFVF